MSVTTRFGRKPGVRRQQACLMPARRCGHVPACRTQPRHASSCDLRDTRFMKPPRMSTLLLAVHACQGLVPCTQDGSGAAATLRKTRKALAFAQSRLAGGCAGCAATHGACASSMPGGSHAGGRAPRRGLHRSYLVRDPPPWLHSKVHHVAVSAWHAWRLPVPPASDQSSWSRTVSCAGCRTISPGTRAAWQPK